jgi:thiol:disulfide interchange protein DsbD
MLNLFRVAFTLAMFWIMPVHGQNNFLAPEQAFRLEVTKLDNQRTRLYWTIEKGYYLYRKQIKVDSTPAGTLGTISLPAGEIKKDEFFGESQVYHDHLDVTVDAPAARELHIGWQGCAEEGLCYPPQILRIKLDEVKPASASLGTPSASTASAAGNLGGEDQALAQGLTQGNLGWMIVVFFGLGLLMTFTPCVWPMLPILSSLIAGSGATARRSLVLSLAFVVPMALTYAALGAGTALAGANLQAMLQTPWVLGAFSLTFAVLAMAMFGFYELQLPAIVRDRLHLASREQQGGTIVGAAAMGILSAVLVGPCMTAPLAGALLYIANTGNVLVGSLALLAMGLGMGVPLVLVATAGSRFLPRPGAWMNRIKAVFGFVLLGTAIFFLARILPSNLIVALWGGWLLAAGLSLLSLAKNFSHGAGRLLFRHLGLLCGLWAAAMVLGAAGGATDPLQPLSFMVKPGTAASAGNQVPLKPFVPVKTAQALEMRIAEARQLGQWTLVDFYADWCISCKRIEQDVFSQPRVQQALADMRLLRADITANDADDIGMLKTVGALGAPTLLLIGPDGVERRAQRIIGELDADEFLARLARAGNGV